jgi:hypothetical protein
MLNFEVSIVLDDVMAESSNIHPEFPKYPYLLDKNLQVLQIHMLTVAHIKLIIVIRDTDCRGWDTWLKPSTQQEISIRL